MTKAEQKVEIEKLQAENERLKGDVVRLESKLDTIIMLAGVNYRDPRVGDPQPIEPGEPR